MIFSLGKPQYVSGQIIIFHQSRFPWNKGGSLTKPPFGGNRSCEVAIIWPDVCINRCFWGISGAPSIWYHGKAKAWSWCCWLLTATTPVDGWNPAITTWGMYIFWLVVEPTHLKNMSQIGNLAPGRDENEKYLKPPSSFLVNNWINYRSLNWWVYRISEPSTVVSGSKPSDSFSHHNNYYLAASSFQTSLWTM